MQGGDISNEIAPRLVIVFEGLVGMIDDTKGRAREGLLIKTRQWRRAVDCYTVNEMMARHILDAVWRRKYQVEVITYKGVPFAEAIEEWLDEHGIPVSKTWATTPDNLSRHLSYRPDIAAVYDPNPSHRFTYGGKGHIIDPANPTLFGAF